MTSLLILSSCTAETAQPGDMYTRAAIPARMSVSPVSSVSVPVILDVPAEPDFMQAPKNEDNGHIEAWSAETAELELPVNGATGYVPAAVGLRERPSADTTAVMTLSPGDAFRIIKEEGDWWFIEKGKVKGWLEHKYCMINLPDVIPSVIYDNTNTYSSRYMSSGKEIPGITGKALYEGKAFNRRLNKDEYIVAVLYPMSKKIYHAQQKALSEGNSLKIYEGYRPLSTQLKVAAALTILSANDPDVMNGINTPPWSINWFIATGISNHQLGYAIDVSLVKVKSKHTAYIGQYSYYAITEYTEYAMPTPIHELSMASAAFTSPLSAAASATWEDALPAGSMNGAAFDLQKYCTSAGLIPLSSEWWHFNDPDAKINASGNGGYVLSQCLSSVPDIIIE